MNYCPISNTTKFEYPWLGVTEDRQKKYDYLQCAGCGWLYFSPMLTLMDGDGYRQHLSVETCHSDGAGINKVIKSLKNREKRVFFDYAWGAGLLLEVSKIGWEAFRLKSNVETAEKYNRLKTLEYFWT